MFGRSTAFDTVDQSHCISDVADIDNKIIGTEVGNNYLINFNFFLI